MYALEQNKYNIPNERNDTDPKNLVVDKQIFSVFKNVKNVFIMSTSGGGSYCYTFSLTALAWLIDSTSVEKVIVQAVLKGYPNKDSWVSLLWDRSSSKIKQKYEQKKYAITYKRRKKGQDRWGDNIYEDCFEISSRRNH
eukprot:533430_1